MKYESSISLLRSLIAIPSFSREEKDAADFFQQHIEAMGVKTCRKGNNIWAYAGEFDKQKKTVRLSNGEDVYISKAHYKETLEI